MKRQLFAFALCAFTTPLFAADVGLSISIGDPNFFGSIKIGNAIRPEVIFRDPIIITKPRRHERLEPIYLRVRPGHEKHWRKHCHEYHACGRPVFFIRDTWYRKRYESRYHEHHRHYHERRAERRHERRRDRREDRREERRHERHHRDHDRHDRD